MKQRRRIYYSAAQRDEMWDRWRRGHSLHDIGRLFDRGHSSVLSVLAPSGGIRPPPRKRSRLALSLAEREEISRGLVAGRSIRAIGAALGRAPSTISREIARNGGSKPYRAAKADKRAWQSALRPKPCKLALDGRLRHIVIVKLQRRWSPQQIAGWLKREAAKIKAATVSHETIYRSLYVQTRGVLKKELARYLRSQRQMRRSRHAKQATDRRGQIRNAVSISERPACVADRAVPGHWEGDLLCGPSNSFVATLVERHSRYVMLAKVASSHTEAVVNALIRQAKHLPEELYKSLTWDRGHELADHQRFTMETNIAVYFCDPQSPWQRGSNENTNRLLREYLPKGTNLSRHSQTQLNKIARELNERPRKTLDYQTPAERFNECVASIG
jgi:IS30 family transposase